jgi:aspartyl-tRNA(Asn)/glutamyl-tRNA(Gln) amidotransferase subunit B
VSSLETLDRTRVFPVIGLEVHAQLQTRSKLFCSCPVTVVAPANSATCPVCLGFPGTLPVTNRHAVTLAVKLAAAVGGEIHPDSRFARKNYFYPDLPKGYQISQYDRPISTGGSIEIDTPAGTKSIRLVRIHMEEDAGKLLHDTPYDDVPPTVSLVDWNRCGVALVEIVSEPDLRSSEEASAYLTELRRLLRYTGVSDADMEKGNMRCDANVSVRASADAELGTRVEIKNLNSIRYVARAIEHEIERQAEAFLRGERIVMETRLWDVAAGRTVSMRGKEEAHDYRYFPEPDLGALIVDEAWIAEAKSELPELPRARQSRFVSQYGLSRPDAETLTSARELADYFEKVAQQVPSKLAANWITGEVLRWMKERKHSPEQALSFSVTPDRLTVLLSLLDEGAIPVAAAKEELARMAALKWVSSEATASIEALAGVSAEGKLGSLEAKASFSPEAIVERSGKITDSKMLEQLAAEIVATNPSQTALYRSGKTQTFGWFVGQVMKKTSGRADPNAVREALERALG